jgi:uncharacterized membrane protein
MEGSLALSALCLPLISNSAGVFILGALIMTIVSLATLAWLVYEVSSGRYIVVQLIVLEASSPFTFFCPLCCSIHAACSERR